MQNSQDKQNTHRKIPDCPVFKHQKVGMTDYADPGSKQVMTNCQGTRIQKKRIKLKYDQFRRKREGFSWNQWS